MLKIIKFIITKLQIIFSLLKIHNNQILFLCHSGEFIDDNPKCIYDCLLLEKNKLVLLWAVNKKCYAQNKNEGYCLVLYKSFRFYVKYYTSKIIIINDALPSYLIKRKGQIIINTWHGGGAYKKIISNSGKEKYENIVREKFNNYSCILSSSRIFSELVLRKELAYKGKILEIGMPRNDIFFKIKKKTKVKEIYGIPIETKVVLYAPTWRETECFLNVEHCQVIVKALERRFKNKFVLLYRSHYLDYIAIGKNNVCINVTDYNNIQDLLIEADILITDYSSIIWDYAIMNKPCFLYCPDYDIYSKQVGFVTDIDEWGCDVSYNIFELIRNIQSYNNSSSLEKLLKMKNKWMSFDDGCATEKISEFIMKIIGGEIDV